ncbi:MULTISPECIES: head GIN domain-containing protein [Sphingobacterium]|uniref:Head GIN domain-containing protein n=2 Tax=Sphingobacterium TaxID=28453 RepID=A0ABW5YRT9_9SPHI|nr:MULTISPECIES: head GIN domain-containing protein [Sphingobacterium]MBB2951859.1 hypothetical protein [Sphingobacterium sp. JUb56]MCS3554060.1 hypothetical protein [Sphingobacterium sp. JUb21]MCW2260390.1 hypothetical protein [Sphingobacterium kitahiroshimense]NJI71727.1 DUF2807 domain-containing protein [Sphingobacterium sp. B16(2022)]QQD13635.1 DUF2807 domain-containing protein [Sphingobacterium sp. UDSM-2020]
MKKLGLGAILFFIAQLGIAQTKQNVGTFNSVDVTDKIQVELIHGNSNEVVTEGANSENIQVINKNGALRIKMNTLNALQGNNISVKVYYQSLNSLSAKKGAKIVNREKEKIVADQLNVSAAEGGLVVVYVEAKKVDVKPTSGSTISLIGKSITQDVVSNFGGKYEGKELITDVTNVTVNGGGQAEVYAKDSIVAKTRAGGVIEVYGKPAHKSEKKLAGGIINYK